MNVKDKAKDMRKRGYLLKEIAERLEISTGRVSQLTGPMGNNGAFFKRNFIEKNSSMDYKDVAKQLSISQSWAYSLVDEKHGK